MLKVPMLLGQTVMSNINNAAKMYYQTRGEWPSEIDELERAGQLDVSRSTKLNGHLIFSLVIRVDGLLPLAQKKCQAEQVTKLSMMLILESLQGMVLLGRVIYNGPEQTA